MSTPGSIPVLAKCGNCGHPFTFHNKSVFLPCQASGCRSGPDGAPCARFEYEEASSTVMSFSHAS
jgi:hypothetical protein